jgi:hypothetical protein
MKLVTFLRKLFLRVIYGEYSARATGLGLSSVSYHARPFEASARLVSVCMYARARAFLRERQRATAR